jgi:hypothetical protein
LILTENRKVKQVLSGRLVPVGGGGYKESVKECEYGGNTKHVNGKMRFVDTYRNGVEGVKGE